MILRIVCWTLAASLSCAVCARAETEQSAHWQISRHGDGWQLLKDGQPFYVQGAVGWNRFDVLRACGGNAVRTRALLSMVQTPSCS